MTAIDTNNNNATCMINIPLDESNTVESPTTFGSHLEEAENTNDIIDSPLPIQEGAQTFSHGDNKRIHTWTDVLEHLRQKLHESLLQHQQRALRDGCVDIQTNEEANGQVQDEYIYLYKEKLQVFAVSSLDPCSKIKYMLSSLDMN